MCVLSTFAAYISRVLVCCSLCALAFYGYFLKPHESQSYGSVTVPSDQEGVAYCAVNPEDGVGISYTVCAYRGAETDLDKIASPFIANGSSDCCLCGMCDDGVLGSGVTAVLSPSPPSSNNFSVPACQVRSKTAVDGSFVCLAHRVTVMQSSKEQALALFHFQLQMPTAAPQDQTIPYLVTISLLAAGMVACIVVFLLFCCKKWRCARSCGSYQTDEPQTVSGSGERENSIG